MHAEREFIDVRTLAAEVEDTDFGIGYTTVETGFGIWLLKNTLSAQISNVCY